MNLDNGYVLCRVCKHPYRPEVDESVRGHHRATGHAPTPLDAPETRTASGGQRSDERPVTPGELVSAAASRLAEHTARADLLARLADRWAASPDPTRTADAAALRTVLERPPVYGLGALDGLEASAGEE